MLRMPFRTSNANAHAQRFVRTVRSECLDFLLILNATTAGSTGESAKDPGQVEDEVVTRCRVPPNTPRSSTLTFERDTAHTP